MKAAVYVMVICTVMAAFCGCSKKAPSAAPKAQAAPAATPVRGATSKLSKLSHTKRSAAPVAPRAPAPAAPRNVPPPSPAPLMPQSPVVQANEQAAIADLRAICAVETDYAQSYGAYTTFPMLIQEGSLQGDWSKSRNGYLFNLTTTGPAFACTAVPEQFGETGVRQFFVDQTGMIHATNDGSPASATSPSVTE